MPVSRKPKGAPGSTGGQFEGRGLAPVAEGVCIDPPPIECGICGEWKAPRELNERDECWTCLKEIDGMTADGQPVGAILAECDCRVCDCTNVDDYVNGYIAQNGTCEDCFRDCVDTEGDEENLEIDLNKNKSYMNGYSAGAAQTKTCETCAEVKDSSEFQTDSDECDTCALTDDRSDANGTLHPLTIDPDDFSKKVTPPTPVEPVFDTEDPNWEEDAQKMLREEWATAGGYSDQGSLIAVAWMKAKALSIYPDAAYLYIEEYEDSDGLGFTHIEDANGEIICDTETLWDHNELHGVEETFNELADDIARRDWKDHDYAPGQHFEPYGAFGTEYRLKLR